MGDIHNILIVSTANRWGGAEKVASCLADTYRTRGFNATLAVGFITDMTSQAVLIPNLARRNPLTRFAERLVPSPSAGNLNRTSRIVRQLVKGIAEPGRAYAALAGHDDFAHPGTAWILEQAARYDVVHLHNLHGGYFDLRMLPELCQIAPVVMTAHDMWLATGHCAQAIDCQRWQNGCGNCPHLDFPPAVRRDATHQNFMQKHCILAQSQYVLCSPSQWLDTTLSESIAADGSIKRAVVRNGVDTSAFQPQSRDEERRKLGIGRDTFVFGFGASGATSPYKDFECVQRVLASSDLHNHPREIVALGIGGIEPMEAHGSLRIITLPRITDDYSMAAALACCDTYIHTAKADTAPLSVLEAQACGVPVIATRVGGIPEMVAPDGAILVESGDSDGIIKALLELEGDAERRNTMANAAAKFGARYSLDAMADGYMSVYEQAYDAKNL